ncbi:MAG: tetratricopeptide repeat protein [Phycisphaerae bacterium]
MAKRKKLNTRVVVLLSVFGVLLLALVVSAVIGWMPRDPEQYFNRGMAAFENGEYNNGQRFLMEAINQSKRKGAEKAEYYYQLARLQREWAEESDELTRAQQQTLLGQSRANLDAALRVDESYMPAHRLLTETYWQGARGRGGTGSHWDDFIERIDKLIELEPDNHEAIYRRAVAKSHQVAVKGEYYEQALEDYRRAIELKDDQPEYWLGMIRLLIERNNLIEAETALTDAIEANPQSAEIRSFYSQYLASRGQSDEALAQIREVIEQNPDSATPYLTLASLHERRDEREAALEALKKAKEVEPDSWIVNNQLASHYDRTGQTELAVEELREGLGNLAAEMDRMKAEDLSVSERMAAERRIQNARLSMNRGLGLLLVRLAERSDDPEQAEAYLQEAEKHAEVIREFAPDSYLDAEISGRIARQRGDLTTAISQLEKAYEHYGARRNPPLAMELMQLYLRRDMPGRAEEVLDRLLQIPGLTGNLALLLTKAQLEIEYRDYDQAEQILQGILRSDPDNEQARNLMATVEAMRSGGTVTLPEGVQPGRRLVRALQQQAASAWVRGNRTQAVRILEQLHDRLPEDWGVSSQLASAYVGMEENEKAREVLEQARQYHPEMPQLEYAVRMLDETDPDKRFELAMEATVVEEDPAQRELSKAAVCAVFGRREQYAEHLKKAMELDPDSPEVVSRTFQYALSEEDWDLAEQCVAAAEEANLDDLDGRLYRAQMAAVRGRYEEVIELLEEPLQSRPDMKRAWILLAASYTQVGRLQDARETYSELWSIDPSYAPAAIGLAAVTERLGDEDEHRRWVRRAYALAPDDPYVRNRYLNLQEESGDPYQAIEQREELLQQNPDDPANMYRLALLYERTDQLDKAEEMFSRYAEQVEDELSGAAVMAAFFERTRQYSRMDELIGRLLNTHDDTVGVYQLWGQLLQERNPAQAEQAYLQAVREAPQDPRGHWSLANFYSQRNQHERALEYFRTCVELAPDNVRYRKGLMGQLINAGHYDEAARRLDEYRNENPDDVEAMTFAGVLAFRRGNADEARDLLDRAVERSPENPEPLRYRAQLKVVEGLLEEAAEDLRKAREISDNPQIGVQLADVQLRMGDQNGAESTLRDVVSRYRGYGPAIQQLIGIYQQSRRWNQLESFLEEIQRQFPNDPTYLIQEAEMWAAREAPDREVSAMAKAYNLAPASEQIIGRYLNALLKSQDYQKVLEVTQRRVDSGDAPAWVLAVQGRAQSKLGREAEAEQSFTEALERMELPEMRSVGSQIRMAYGREQALEQLRAWQNLRPGEPMILMLIAQLHQEAREHERAIEVLLEADQIADTDSETAEVNKLLGPSYQSLGQVSEAEQAYLKCLEHKGRDPYVLNNLAYLYVDALNEPEKALPYAEQAVQMLPENAPVLDTYGWALFKAGRTADAERYLVRAAQLGQAGATVRYHLGVVYEDAGRNRDALQQYRRAYEMVRDDEGHELHAELQEAVSRVEGKLSG